MPIDPPIEVGSDSKVSVWLDFLTCASSVPNRLPRAFSSSGILGRTYALTVAGQWRTFTALLNYQTLRL
jgi:hypothetical protein